MKLIKVNAIKNGTVIDHIPAGKVLKVVDLVNLTGENSVMIGMNLTSAKLGRKDIIKIENRVLSADEVNVIAMLAPEASLIIIKDFAVVSKQQLTIPREIDGLIVCPNPKCITNIEGIKSRFTLSSEDKKIVRCAYCEKKYEIDDVEMIV
ncbi:MAG: aspartate carbamoyltransferase regulatory subunit [Candidatus Cloacimonetes bacterium]|nr:aspartate carbamoyltransferase regulatory subunit [Candidatus Cloacimonadota bacterium]